MSEPERRVIVVGAGLAGLTCAAQLQAAGHAVTVFEAEDDIGGRTRTLRTPDGFLIDHGFQVLFDAYPTVRRQLDLPALACAPFDAGANVWTGTRLVPVVNPLRHPAGIVRDLTSPVLSLADGVHLAALAVRAVRAPWACVADAANAQAEDRSIAQLLTDEGFSDTFIDDIARGFWGGITLDRGLNASSGVFLFTLKMLVQGHAVLPAGGMGALARALAARLPEGAIRLRRRVTGFLSNDGGVAGVRVGEQEHRAAVVVATDPWTARALTGIDAIPAVPVGCVTVYLAGSRDPGVGRRLVIDGTGASRVNSIAPLSVVQPAYAPPGRHLIAAVLLGAEAMDADDETVASWAEEAVPRMLDAPAGAWRVVQSVRTPHALYAQPPGSHRRLPDVVTGTPGLFLASDATVDASINGAILSGEAAARAVRAALPDGPDALDRAPGVPRDEEQ